MIDAELLKAKMLQHEIESMIDQLPAKRVWVENENRCMLKYQFEPKLALA
jgi:hypothetical protein